jgi:hypothetical protein
MLSPTFPFPTRRTCPADEHTLSPPPPSLSHPPTLPTRAHAIHILVCSSRVLQKVPAVLAAEVSSTALVPWAPHSVGSTSNNGHLIGHPARYVLVRREVNSSEEAAAVARRLMSAPWPLGSNATLSSRTEELATSSLLRCVMFVCVCGWVCDGGHSLIPHLPFAACSVQVPPPPPHTHACMHTHPPTLNAYLGLC